MFTNCPYRCPKCALGFDRINDIKYHMTRYIPCDYLCNWCGYYFIDRTSFVDHWNKDGDCSNNNVEVMNLCYNLIGVPKNKEIQKDHEMDRYTKNCEILKERINKIVKNNHKETGNIDDTMKINSITKQLEFLNAKHETFINKNP